MTNVPMSVWMAITKRDQRCRFFPARSVLELLQKTKASYELTALIQRLPSYSMLVVDDGS